VTRSDPTLSDTEADGMEDHLLRVGRPGGKVAQSAGVGAGAAGKSDAATLGNV